MVVPALLPCHGAGLFLGPVGQGDCGRDLCFRIPRSENHKIIARQLDPVEGCMIIGDDLAKIEPEFLERGVAAGLFLKLGKADLPLRLAPAVFAADFI